MVLRKKYFLGYFSFDIIFQNYSYFTNDDSTRSFCYLSCLQGPGYDSVLKMIELVDKILESFKFPTYYKPPTPHASFAWCLGDVKKIFEKEKFNNSFETNEKIKVQINSISLKIGQKVDVFELKNLKSIKN